MAAKKKVAKAEPSHYMTGVDEYSWSDSPEEAATVAMENGDLDFDDEVDVYEIRKVGVARKASATFVKA